MRISALNDPTSMHLEYDYDRLRYRLTIEDPFVGYAVGDDGGMQEIRVRRGTDHRVARALAALFECDVVVE